MSSGALDRSRLILVLRWVVFLPLAFVAGALARIMLYEGTLSVLEICGVYPFSFLPSVFVVGVPYGVQGAVMVIVATWIAPVRSGAVLVGATVLSVLLGAYALFEAIVLRAPWGIYGAIALVVGACVAAWGLFSQAIHRREILAPATSRGVPVADTSGASSLGQGSEFLSRQSLMAGLRWVAFFPAAVLGSTLAYVIVYWGNRWIFGIMGMNPDSFWNSLFLEGVPYAAFGAAFVFISVWLVPTRKTAVSLGMGALSVLIAGLVVFVGLAARDWWSIYNAVAQVVGTVVLIGNVYSGEISVDPGSSRFSAG